MDAETRQLVLLCFAWAGLRHWRLGREAGDAARDVVEVRLDLMRGRYDLNADLCDLEVSALERLGMPRRASA